MRVIHSIAVHERTHVDDMLKLKADICKGKPKGMVVEFPTNVIAATEIRASQAEIDCLEALLKAAQCTDNECKETINARISQMQKYRDSFK